MNCWYIPADKFKLSVAFDNLQPQAFIDYSALKTIRGDAKNQCESGKKRSNKFKETTLPDGYLEMLEQKRYSDSTIRDRDISPSVQNQRINAIKFYYEKVLGREKQYYRIERPRKELKLPDVLSKQEIASMVNNTKNLKHKCLLVIMYSCGLRRSEVIHLRLTDIDSSRMLVKIRGAKGNKDRYVQLAGGTLIILREYYKEYRSEGWSVQCREHCKCSEAVRKEGGDNKEYLSPHTAAQFRNASFRAGDRFKVHSGMARSQQFKDNRAIHTCVAN